MYTNYAQWRYRDHIHFVGITFTRSMEKKPPRLSPAMPTSNNSRIRASFQLPPTDPIANAPQRTVDLAIDFNKGSTRNTDRMTILLS